MLTANSWAPVGFAVRTLARSMGLTTTSFVSVLPLLYEQPDLRLINCSLNIPCPPRFTPASSPRRSNSYMTSRDIDLALEIGCLVSYLPWNSSSFRMIVLRTSGIVFFTFPAISRTAMTPSGRPGMRPLTSTPLQPLFLVTLCTFPAVDSSVPGPVPPARPATMRFELVARLESFLRGRMLGGMLMGSPVLSMDLSKLARSRGLPLRHSSGASESSSWPQLFTLH